MIRIKARPAEAGNVRNSSGRVPRTITKFSKASAPANAPYPRPAGNADIDYFGLRLVAHVLIGDSLT